MKHIEIINAYKALDSLTSQRLPLPVSYKLFKLRGEMQKIYDFRLEETKSGAIVKDGKVMDVRVYCLNRSCFM